MAGANYYDILGVGRDATMDDIQQAYRNRAMLFHPDRHHAGSEEVRREAERIMSDLNVAYATLRDPGQRAAYDRMLDHHRISETAPPAARPPGDDECIMCGSFPAADVTFHQHVGKLLWREKRVLDARLCRACGRMMAAEVTNRTLVTGWWGLISFFANWLTLLQNLQAWRTVSALASPQRRAERIMAPMPFPAPSPRPIYRWAGAWVTAVLLLFIGVTVAGELDSQSPAAATTQSRPNTGSSSGASGGATGGSSSTIYDLKGRCLVYDHTGEQVEDVVSCSVPHDARIVDVVSDADLCRTPYYFTLPTGVLCVDG